MHVELLSVVSDVSFVDAVSSGVVSELSEESAIEESRSVSIAEVSSVGSPESRAASESVPVSTGRFVSVGWFVSEVFFVPESLEPGLTPRMQPDRRSVISNGADVMRSAMVSVDVESLSPDFGCWATRKKGSKFRRSNAIGSTPGRQA